MAYIGNSPANVGNYQIVDTIAGSFNASLTSFALASGGITITPAKSGQLLVAINGVLQQPDDTGTNGFKVSGSNVVFSSPPASGDTFWAVYQGQNVDIGTPSDDVVDTAHIKDNAITAAKIADGAILAADIGADAVGLSELSATGTTDATTFLRGDNTWVAVDALPSQSGNSGEFLTTNGSTASWAVLSGNTTTKGLYEHAHTISVNYSITSGNNALTAGPITINNGISVTVPTGSSWIIIA